MSQSKSFVNIFVLEIVTLRLFFTHSSSCLHHTFLTTHQLKNMSVQEISGLYSNIVGAEFEVSDVFACQKLDMTQFTNVDNKERDSTLSNTDEKCFESIREIRENCHVIHLLFEITRDLKQNPEVVFPRQKKILNFAKRIYGGGEDIFSRLVMLKIRGMEHDMKCTELPLSVNRILKDFKIEIEVSGREKIEFEKEEESCMAQ